MNKKKAPFKGQGTYGSKADWIRTYPEMEPAKLRALAKKNGVDLPLDYIRKVRFKMHAAELAETMNPLDVQNTAPTPPREEAEFRKALGELGLLRARSIIAAVEELFGLGSK